MIAEKSKVKTLARFYLGGDSPRYVLNDYAQQYLQSYPLAAKHWQRLSFSTQVLATEQTQWQDYLTSLGII
ncbi:MAG: hypothetical protein DCF17_09260, partial [Shackletoniella antarctica]